MTALRIEVALCSYNGERFLPDQLASIHRQSRPPDRVVICDDASEDGTLAVAEKFATSISFPVEIHSSATRLGVRANFSRAISLCGKGLIVLADQDDVWVEDRLEVTESAFEDADVLATFADADVVDQDLESSGQRLWETVSFTAEDRKRMREGGAPEVLLKKDVATGATMAFRSSLKRWILPIPAPWVHDAWIALIAASAGGLTFTEDPVIRYRRHSSNTVGLPGGSVFRRPRFYGRSLDRHLLATAEGYEAAYDRLNAMPQTVERDRVLALIREKLDHLEARQDIRGHGLMRISGVIRELRTGRYGRYGRGLSTAINDLLLLGVLDREQFR